MTALLLEPHQDDAVLFAAFTCLRHRPHVITVLRSKNQEANGITSAEREAENAAAMNILGCSWGQMGGPHLFGDTGFGDDAPDWELIARLWRSPARGSEYERVFAPWPQKDGHEQHNRVGELAVEVFGQERVTFYTTYAYGGGRTTGEPVPYEPEWILLKLRALACYESQILRGPRRFWMMGLDEYTRDIVAQP